MRLVDARFGHVDNLRSIRFTIMMKHVKQQGSGWGRILPDDDHDLPAVEAALVRRALAMN
jgi:hypothetical protein